MPGKLLLCSQKLTPRPPQLLQIWHIGSIWRVFTLSWFSTFSLSLQVPFLHKSSCGDLKGMMFLSQATSSITVGRGRTWLWGEVSGQRGSSSHNPMEALGCTWLQPPLTQEDAFPSRLLTLYRLLHFPASRDLFLMESPHTPCFRPGLWVQAVWSPASFQGMCLCLGDAQRGAWHRESM